MSTHNDLLIYFAREREAIRKLREAGAPPPWTDDEILRAGSFCNVNREHDAVTVWIRENWREPYRDDPDVWFLMLVARLINAPEVLGAITISLPWNKERFIAEMTERKAQGLPLERSAYTITAGRGFANKFTFLAECIFDPLWQARESVRPKPGDSCQSFCDRLVAFDYIGDFYAGQIIADTKFTPALAEAPDWFDFVAAGPGSGRWLNVVLGRAIEPPLKGPEFYSTFKRVRAEVTPQLEAAGLHLSAQDLQNCMCESFKLWRARETGQMPRRLYRPEGKKPAPRAKAPKPTPSVEPAPIEPTPHALPELSAARDPNVPHTLFMDFETKSTADLKSVGAWRYAADGSTQILCLAFAVDDEPVQLWAQGDPVPPEFLEVAANPLWITVAHNDAFERAIAEHVLSRHGFPLVPISRRRCSMAMASAASLPAGLEKAALKPDSNVTFFPGIWPARSKRPGSRADLLELGADFRRRSPLRSLEKADCQSACRLATPCLLGLFSSMSGTCRKHACAPAATEGPFCRVSKAMKPASRSTPKKPRPSRSARKRSPYFSSRISSGLNLLPTIDGRSSFARTFRATYSAMVSHCAGGEDPPEPLRLMCRRAAALESELTHLEIKFAAAHAAGAEPVMAEIDLHSRLTNTLRRVCEVLGWRRSMRDITPSLESYLSTEYAGDAGQAGAPRRRGRPSRAEAEEAELEVEADEAEADG